MSADTKTKNTWIIALLISIVVNGLLAGLLLSKQVNPTMPDPDMPPPQMAGPNGLQTVPNNPRHLVRTLEPARRKQVMTAALKNLKLQGTEHPRRLFKQLRQAKVKTMRLLRADELDAKAIEQSLADIRALNQKLAVSGDALMIEVLTQLTPEERKAAREALKDRKTLRRRRGQ